MRILLSLVALVFGLNAGPALADLRLLMIEQDGCVYCARWDREIAPIYPNTPEGKAAPLERVQIRGPYPSDATLGQPPVYTPTFVLLTDGRETGRIEGYLGEDFFWGLLGQMLDQSGQFIRE